MPEIIEIAVAKIAVVAAPSPARLIACFDGTWNSDRSNTNVSRLFRKIADETCRCSEQRRFYDEGVGTKWGERLRGGVFGIGLDDCAMAQQGQQMSLHRAGQRIVVDHRDAGRRSLLGRTRFRFVHHRPRPAHGVPAGEIYPKRLRVEAKSRAPWSAAVQPPAGELGFVRVDRGWRGFRGGSLGLAGGRMRARLAQALGLLLLSLRLLALALFKSVIGLGQLVS